METRAGNAGSHPQSLRERLAAMQGGRPTTPAPPARPPETARRVEFDGGLEEETPFGPCYVIERRYPLDYRHGPRPLGALHEVAPALLADLAGDPRLAQTPLERILLLDT